MKKKTVVDLIIAHYEGDDRAFFANALDVLKEFKQNGDQAIVDRLDFVLKSHVKIAPKREVSKTKPEVSFEDAVDLGWIPMMETQNKNHGSGITAEEMIEMMKDIKLIPKEEAIAYLDGLLKKEDK